jgi:hypothetical protein
MTMYADFTRAPELTGDNKRLIENLLQVRILGRRTDLPGPAPLKPEGVGPCGAGEPQTPDREVKDEGRALGGLNNAQLPGPELAPRNAGHEDRAGGLDDTETVTRVISDGGER